MTLLDTRLPAPKAILFDWDNTLVDTFPMIHHAMNNTRQTFGRTLWSVDDTRRYTQRSARDSMPQIFGEQWPQALTHFTAYYEAEHLRHLQPLLNADSLLQTVQQNTILMGVVSNKRRPILDREIVHLGWEKYFISVIGAGDAPHDKPHPAPLLTALEEMNIDAGMHVWFVGDAPVDWQCAQAAGCTPILLGALLTDPPILPLYSVPDCHTLQKTLISSIAYWNEQKQNDASPEE